MFGFFKSEKTRKAEEQRRKQLQEREQLEKKLRSQEILRNLENKAFESRQNQNRLLDSYPEISIEEINTSIFKVKWYNSSRWCDIDGYDLYCIDSKGNKGLLETVIYERKTYKTSDSKYFSFPVIVSEYYVFYVVLFINNGSKFINRVSPSVIVQKDGESFLIKKGQSIINIKPPSYWKDLYVFSIAKIQDFSVVIEWSLKWENPDYSMIKGFDVFRKFKDSEETRIASIPFSFDTSKELVFSYRDEIDWTTSSDYSYSVKAYKIDGSIKTYCEYASNTSISEYTVSYWTEEYEKINTPPVQEITLPLHISSEFKDESKKPIIENVFYTPNGYVKITWRSILSCDGYEIIRQNGGETIKLGGTDGSAISFTDRHPEENSQYRIRAFVKEDEEKRYGEYSDWFISPPLPVELLTKKPPKATIDFDNMEGHEFENFCAELLRKNGFEEVSVTKGSGDQGLDILAIKDCIKYGIQCKCYSSEVGNKAVQEAYSGKTFYNQHVGVVLTNNYFTPAAKELANKNGIILWDRQYLLKLMQVL